MEREPTPFEKELEAIDREGIAKSEARRKANSPGIPSERMHAFLLELQRRFDELGRPDSEVARELCEKVKRGELL